MAQMDGLRYLESSTGEQLIPGGDEEQGHWPSPATPTSGKSYEHEDEHSHHHTKKSVLMKVKEKAKKWRQSLAKKKHDHDAGEENHYTPARGVSLDKEDDEDEDQDPEYHGAPMYESEMAPNSYKVSAQHHPNARREKAARRPNAHAPPPATSEPQHPTKTPAATAAKHASEGQAAHGDPAGAMNGSNKTLTETVSDMLAPAYAMVTEATHVITSKIQSPRGASGEESVSKQMWDKGVSVKEYLMQKLEPGEDEKTLSEVISVAMSPRKAGNAGELGVVGKGITLSEIISETIMSPRKAGNAAEMGVVEKVKGAVTSILGIEEPPATTLQPNQVSKDTRLRRFSSAMSQPLPISTNPHVFAVSTKSQPIPLSSNPRPIPPVSTISHTSPVPYTPYADEIQEEESCGRILQAYTN